MIPPESVVQRKIISQLKKAGWIVDKPVNRSHKGFPDITAYRNGETVFVEVKRPGGKTTKLQDFWIRTLNKNGFLAIVIDNWKELKKYGLI